MDLENRAKDLFVQAVAVLEKEWSVDAPVSIAVSILDDKSFRGGQTSGPESWKYCFLLRDQRDGKIYCNVDIFNVLPDDALKMIKHETDMWWLARLSEIMMRTNNRIFWKKGRRDWTGRRNVLSRN